MGVVEKARNTDPATSWEAAKLADLPGSQASVLQMLAHYGPLTHSLLSRVFPFWRMIFDGPRYSQSRIRTAVSELVRRGLVTSDGVTVNEAGRHEKVWRLVTRDET